MIHWNDINSVAISSHRVPATYIRFYINLCNVLKTGFKFQDIIHVLQTKSSIIFYCVVKFLSTVSLCKFWYWQKMNGNVEDTYCYLVLENGAVFPGTVFGARREVDGEIGKIYRHLLPLIFGILSKLHRPFYKLNDRTLYATNSGDSNTCFIISAAGEHNHCLSILTLRYVLLHE